MFSVASFKGHFLRQKSSTKSIIRVILNGYNYQHDPSFRRTKPKEILEDAAEDTPEYMRRTGWHQCTDVLDEKQALFAIEDELGDPDYTVSATRTCAGFIVWNHLA